MKHKAHLYHIYCKFKNRIQREKQVIQSDQDVHMHGLWWMEWKLLLYDLSPYINSFESMAISFFSVDLHVPTFFFSIFFQYLYFHVSIFFVSITHASLFKKNKNWSERPTQIVEHLFCGMSGWYNANFSKKHSKGVYGVHVNLDHESMTKVWQSSMEKEAAYVYTVFKKYHHMALVGLCQIKEELCKDFPNFQIKFPST